MAYRIKKLVAERKRLEESKGVLIIGGGAVGVEYASEIKHALPHVNVTLVQRNKYMVPRCPMKAHTIICEKFKELGVMYYNEYEVQDHDGSDGKLHTYKCTNTQTGKVMDVEADTAIWAGGASPNTEFLKTYPLSLRDKEGLVTVNEYLQVCEAPKDGGEAIVVPNIFCGGDCAAVVEEKTAANAGKYADIIVQNLRAAVAEQVLTKYTSKVPLDGIVTLLSFGQGDGAVVGTGINIRRDCNGPKMLFAEAYRQVILRGSTEKEPSSAAYTAKVMGKFLPCLCCFLAGCMGPVNRRLASIIGLAETPLEEGAEGAV